MELGIDMFGDLHFNKNGEIQSAGERLHEVEFGKMEYDSVF